MPEKVQIKVDLTGEAAQKLKLIKEYYGITSNAEIVRLLITRMYAQLIENRK